MVAVAKRKINLSAMQNSDMYQTIISQLNHFDRPVSNTHQLTKWVSRKIKHYLHSLQFAEYVSKSDKSVYYVYGIRNNRYPGYIKIGYTQSMESRLTDFKVYTPIVEDISVVCYRPTKNGRFAEKKLHSLFERYRANGEWFKIREDEFIVELETNFQLEFNIQGLVEKIQRMHCQFNYRFESD